MRTTTHSVAEALLRDLADHEVRVVAVGRDDDRVGVLDAGLAQARRRPCRGRATNRRASPRRAARAPPPSRRPRSPPSPLGELTLRDIRPDTAAADHQCLHGLTVAHVVAYAGSSSVRLQNPLRERDDRAPRRAPSSAHSRPSARRNATGAATRGAEPSTIRSTPSSSAWLTIASPDRTGADRPSLDLDVVIGAQQLGFGQCSGGTALPLRGARRRGAAPSAPG